MSLSRKASIVVLGTMLAFHVQAQDSSNDQADVWATVERQWNAAESDDKEWYGELLADEFAGWENSSPAPRNRASTEMWDRVMDGVNTMKAHELYPLSIVVREDVAVAHYLYTSVNEDKDGNIKTENGRYTDTLVRTEQGWKFLAWHGGESH